MKHTKMIPKYEVEINKLAEEHLMALLNLSATSFRGGVKVGQRNVLFAMQQHRKELAAQPTPDWAKAELEKAKAMGITDGTRPFDFIARAEAAVMDARRASK